MKYDGKNDEVTGIFVMDMAPLDFAGRRYIVSSITAAPGMMLGPVAAGPFDTEEAAQREADRLEAGGSPLPRTHSDETNNPDREFTIYTMGDSRILVTQKVGGEARRLRLKPNVHPEYFRRYYERFIQQAWGGAGAAPPSAYDPAVGPESTLATDVSDPNHYVTTLVTSDVLDRMDDLRALLICFE